jgi:superfamily II DNA or RNA helicase
MLRRFSSRLGRLQHVFLAETLAGARRYLRIAGYFRSSLFELVNEQLEGIDEIRIVCNSDLDPQDIGVARTAREQGLALKEKWNEQTPPADAALHQGRYKKLFDHLTSGKLKVRVVPRTVAPFLHGKAGIIEARDGRKTSFLGSMNETREGWNENYELMWEDDSPEAIQWVQDEFDFLWAQGIDLPEVVIEEIERTAHRQEYERIEDVPAGALPAAALAEAPLYQRGEALQPWQQAFVGLFLKHREMYGKTRLVLADEVGVGKTLSLATSAVVASLLGDGPALVLCPSTLTVQWQMELWDKLGVPSAVWTGRKTWLDHRGHEIRTRGVEDVARCPFQIGIVSTGLLVHQAPESQALLARKGGFGTLILDEAHRARVTGGIGTKAGEPNNLLLFMMEAAKHSKHVLLGTATPIQTATEELWNLLRVLGQGAEFVLGRTSLWQAPVRILPLITGKKVIEDEGDVWDLLRNPLPPRSDGVLFDQIREDLNLPERCWVTSKSALDLTEGTRERLHDENGRRVKGLPFFVRNNPIVRHTVLRRRADLEKKGLLPKIAVDLHPTEAGGPAGFVGQALLTNPNIDDAYAAAARFSELLGRRTRSAGFLKSMLLQRICSSLAAGISTARKLLERKPLDDDDDNLFPLAAIQTISADEAAELKTVVEQLEARPEDPKLDAVMHYLLGGPQWLDRYGCIIFSQYFDTTDWVARKIAQRIPHEPVAVYAGAGKSGIYRDGHFATVLRDDIKGAVKQRKIRLVVATDAACEGLNLQTLGSLINVDLPWNPSRLEQRLGRIKRFGQQRRSVDMLNLVYAGTRDQVVYDRLSQRMRDRYDIFGSLPDVIEDDWIDDIEHLDDKLSEFIEKRQAARSAFDLRYGDTIDPEGEPWEKCSKVLSRRDLEEALSRGW